MPRYTALKPQMTPSMPVIVLKVTFPNSNGLPVNSRIVSMKNRIARLRKTNCKARFVLRVPKNIENVFSNAIYKIMTGEVMKEYQTRAVSKGGVYEPASGEVTHNNVVGCLELIKSMAPYLK